MPQNRKFLFWRLTPLSKGKKYFYHTNSNFFFKQSINQSIDLNKFQHKNRCPKKFFIEKISIFDPKMEIDMAIQKNGLMVSKFCDDRQCHQQFIKKFFFKIAVFLKLRTKSVAFFK